MKITSLLLVLLLAGCASQSVETSFYLMRSSNDMETRQLWKLAKRTTLGLARTGAYSSNGSGDYTISFTTKGVSQQDYLDSMGIDTLRTDGYLSPLYKGVVESTEEAIINALFMAETMTGYRGNTRHALPLGQTLSVQDWFHGEK